VQKTRATVNARRGEERGQSGGRRDALPPASSGLGKLKVLIAEKVKSHGTASGGRGRVKGSSSEPLVGTGGKVRWERVGGSGPRWHCCGKVGDKGLMHTQGGAHQQHNALWGCGRERKTSPSGGGGPDSNFFRGSTRRQRRGSGELICKGEDRPARLANLIQGEGESGPVLSVSSQNSKETGVGRLCGT